VWHQQDVNPVTRFSPALLRYAARSTPLLVSNSQHGVDHLVRVVGAPRERVHYAPNGVELAEAGEDRQAWRGRLGAGPDDFVVCMLANLREGKDHSSLLRAWRMVVDRLAQNGRRGLLVLAGSGPAEAEAKALAFDLELGRAVRFLGFVGDVGGLVRASDAGVLASYREGCPNGLLECMAAGLPVAGSDIDGIREVVGPDGYAYLARPGDPAGLAAALGRLADDPELRRMLGEHNAARVETEFSPARMVDVHASLLRRVVRPR
jgi:glycosyltransferase involved in cell wall biosynthesis